MRVNLRVTNQSESFRKNASNNCYDRDIPRISFYIPREFNRQRFKEKNRSRNILSLIQ